MVHRICLLCRSASCFRSDKAARLAPFLLALVVSAGVGGCKEPTAPPSAGTVAAAPADAATPVSPVVTDASTTLLFTYMDERGETKTTGSIASIPESVRQRVYVLDLSKSPEERQAHKYAFFADLTRKDSAGHYPVVAVSRYDGAKGPASTLAPVPDGAVVLYSAVWCGYCKKAKAWFNDKKIPFIERDVEKQPGAQQELTKKLAAAKIQAGGIPVIDVAGEIVVGFDKFRLEALIDKMPSAN